MLKKIYAKEKPVKKHLVIVESPAKCKKIEEILGSEYKCVATYGHLRELNSLQNIDIEHNFTPTYTVIESKKATVSYLKSEIQRAKKVYISSDSDREGEMIGQSIVDLFQLPQDTPRLVYNEISESAIQYAIQHPVQLDTNLINAQKARQILDVLVGFKVSPILRRLIRQTGSLSAGRCQSPALKLVYENYLTIHQGTGQQGNQGNSERENIKEIQGNQGIQGIQGNKVYQTIGIFTSRNIRFSLNYEETSEDQMIQFLEDSLQFAHTYSCSSPVQKQTPPPTPFITSRIQQVASNELHYSPKETMKLCQSLYENGHITYMRTDCARYCSEFMETATAYIRQRYGDAYVGIGVSTEKISSKRKKEKEQKQIHSQEAHEAIRPTDISVTELPDTYDSKERRMYSLIWTNTVESCMSPATYQSITATLTAPPIQGHKDVTYRATSNQIVFAGWRQVALLKDKSSDKTHDNSNDLDENSDCFLFLQNIKPNTVIPPNKITSTVTVTGLKSHYSEAKLVSLLEHHGIGRPSTFSSLIDKIQERGYVKKQNIPGTTIQCRDFELENGEICEIENTRTFGSENNKLVIQPLGIIVMEFLNTHFDHLFQYEYTNLMERALDKIAKGDLIWFELCESCNKEIDEYVQLLRDESRLAIPLDEHNTYIVGKHGPVIKHVDSNQVSFKSVNPSFSLDQIKSGEYSLDDITQTKEPKETCKELGEYTLRTGKHGLYVTCNGKSISLHEPNERFDEIDLDDVKQVLESKDKKMIREINDHMSIRNGPRGDYIYYKNKKMKKPSFHSLTGFLEDYATCNIQVLVDWIGLTYKIH